MRAIWPSAAHQLCVFHATRRVVEAVNDVVKRVRTDPGSGKAITSAYNEMAENFYQSAHVQATLLFALLGAGIWVIEGLELSEVELGEYELICLPVKIERSDGAPARAILRRV